MNNYTLIQSHVKNVILKMKRVIWSSILHRIGWWIFTLLPLVYCLIPATAFSSWWLFSQQ